MCSGDRGVLAFEPIMQASAYYLHVPIIFFLTDIVLIHTL